MIHAPKPWRRKEYQMQMHQWALWFALERSPAAGWLWPCLRFSLEMLPEAKYHWNGNLREEWALLNLIFTNRVELSSFLPVLLLDSQGKRGWSSKGICCLLLPACLNWQEHLKCCLWEEQTISGRAGHTPLTSCPGYCHLKFTSTSGSPRTVQTTWTLSLRPALLDDTAIVAEGGPLGTETKIVFRNRKSAAKVKYTDKIQSQFLT